MKQAWVRGASGAQRKVAAPKRIKRWWQEQADDTITLTVRYGARAIEFEKGKAGDRAEGASAACRCAMRAAGAVRAGELDTHVEKLAQYGRKVRP